MGTQLEILVQLLLATFLGGILGIEREYSKKAAGLRTYSLVCLGSAFFIIIASEFFKSFSGNPAMTFDPSRIIGQIVLGIGFLGGGLIVLRDTRIEGLTTAAGVWVSAAIGAAVGTKLYLPAFFATFLTFAILSVLRKLEAKLVKK